MIKKLLFIFITTYSISIMSQNSFTATVSGTVEVGADLTINTTHSTTESNYKIYAGVLLKNSDGSWAATVLDTNIDPVASGTDISNTLTLTIPSNTTPSADLMGGQYYEMKIELQDENWSWISNDVSVYPALTITAQGSLSTPAFTATVSSTVEAGADLIINTTHSTTESNYKIYAGIELKNSDGTWAATVVDTNIDPVASGTDVSNTLTLTIPSNTTPSADLTGGQYYEMKIELQDESWSWISNDVSAYPALTIAAQGSLSISDLEKLPAVVYPNPAVDFLNIEYLESNKQFTTYKVFDITGRKLLENTNFNTKNIDVETLSKGIYFLQIDNYKPLRFIKE